MGCRRCQGDDERGGRRQSGPACNDIWHSFSPVTSVWLPVFRLGRVEQSGQREAGVGEELLFGVVAPVAEQRP